MGRPALLTAIVGTNTETGEPVTVHDRIISALRAGAFFHEACAFAGIHRDTAYGWLSTAGRIRIRTGGDPDPDEVTDHERNCLRFSDAKAEAEAVWVVQSHLTLERLGRGGIPQVRRVEKRGPDTADGTPGPVLEVTETTEYTLPDARVLLTRMERRFPRRYGRVIGEDDERESSEGLTVEDRQESLLEAFDAYLRGKDDERRRAEAETPVPRPRRKRRARAE